METFVGQLTGSKVIFIVFALHITGSRISSSASYENWLSSTFDTYSKDVLEVKIKLRHVFSMSREKQA